MLARVGFRYRDILFNHSYYNTVTSVPKEHLITEDQHFGDSGGITAQLDVSFGSDSFEGPHSAACLDDAVWALSQ